MYIDPGVRMGSEHFEAGEAKMLVTHLRKGISDIYQTHRRLICPNQSLDIDTPWL